MFTKINKAAMLNSILLTLIIVSLWSNFYIWQEKNIVQTKIVTTPSVFDSSINKVSVEKIILSRGELLEKLNYFKSIEKTNVHNQATFLNLSQIYRVLQESDLSQEYLSKANKI